jgi:hypothetical protein
MPLDAVASAVWCSELGRELMDAPRPEAIGAAVAFLLHCAGHDPNQLRRVLMASNGHARLIDVLVRAAQGRI